MTQIDPIIPKLLDMKHKDQVSRLGAIMAEIRALEDKQAELMREFSTLDKRQDGFDQMSVRNGYLRYLQHRKDALHRQITKLKQDAILVQDELRQTVFSQSVLRE